MSETLTIQDVQKKVPGLGYKAASDRLKLYEKQQITKEQLFRPKSQPLNQQITEDGVSFAMVLNKVKGIGKTTAQQRFHKYKAGIIDKKKLFEPLHKHDITPAQLAILSELRALGDIEERCRKRLDSYEKRSI